MENPNWPAGSDRQDSEAADGDEFAVIDRFRAKFGAGDGAGMPSGEVWIGDDAAAVASPGAGLVLATDLTVAGVHVDLDVCGPDDVGYKAVMVAVSDLAAMGTRPSHLLVSLAAPPGTDLDLVADGVAGAAAEVGAVVVGGDLSTAPVLVVSVAVVGGGGPGGLLLRRGARPGDMLVVTGPLGASAAGLRVLRDQWRGQGDLRGGMPPSPLAALVSAHRRPRARLDEGETARLAGAHAAIDISDGLVADLAHLAGDSGVGVELGSVPVAPGATFEEALGGGEDYELLLATDDPGGLAAAFARAGLRPPLPVGRCVVDPSVRTLDGRALPLSGWRHRFGPG